MGTSSSHVDRVSRVVVGFDGSAASELALDTAVREARSRGADVLLVCVVELPPAMPVDVDSGIAAARAVVRSAARRAAAGLGARRVAEVVEVGPVAATLVRLCDPDDLLVVGSHGHRPVARMLLGSVSTAVVAHAPCPVMVARGPRLRRPGPVVTGYDGSASAMRAVRHAAAAADAAGTRLRMVLALPPITDAWGMVTAPGERERRRAADVLGAATATVRSLYPTLPVEEVVVQGHPVDAMLRQARDARYVVVGSRGLGGLRAMILGSVSRELVHRADCPVIVVRAGDGADEALAEPLPTALAAATAV